MQHSLQTQKAGPEHTGAVGVNKSEQELCTDAVKVLRIIKKLVPAIVLY